MLERVLEPEVMDTEEEARDYDAMDHGAVNARFCEDLVRALGPAATTARRILDVGTGTALIPIELCRRLPSVQIEAIDLAKHMLSLGEANVARAGLPERIRLAYVDAKYTPFSGASFDVVMSNSIVHHIPEPSSVFSEMWRSLAPGGLLFVRDLSRPETNEEIARLVDLHAGARPHDALTAASFDRQKELLRASLAAALSLSEIAAIVAPLGIPADAVMQTSDRHWTLIGRKPA